MAEDPDYTIRPQPGFIYLSPEDREQVKPALDAVRAPARDAFHLAARLAVYVATTESHDWLSGNPLAQPTALSDWPKFNAACVDLFMARFKSLGGNCRSLTILLGDLPHRLVAVTANGAVTHVDPTLGLWVQSADGSYGALSNWVRGEARLLQTDQSLCARMPYRGVHLENAIEPDGPFARPAPFDGVVIASVADLRAGLTEVRLSGDGTGELTLPLAPDSASRSLAEILARLHTLAPSPTVFVTWLNTLCGVYFLPNNEGALSGDIVDEDSAQALWTSRIAICAMRVNFLRYILSNHGLPTRNAGMLGLPYQGDHSAIEVFVDGAWRFFDPTFGVFLARPESPDIPISLTEAHVAFPKVDVMAPVQPFWTGFPTGPDLALATAPVRSEDLIWVKTGEIVARRTATYFLAETAAVGLPVRTEARLVWDIERDGALDLDTDHSTWPQAGHTPTGPALHTLMGVVGRYCGVEFAHAIDLLSREPVRVGFRIALRGAPASAELMQFAVMPRRYVDHMSSLSIERRSVFDFKAENGVVSGWFHLTPPVTTLRFFVPIGTNVHVDSLYVGRHEPA